MVEDIHISREKVRPAQDFLWDGCERDFSVQQWPNSSRVVFCEVEVVFNANYNEKNSFTDIIRLSQIGLTSKFYTRICPQLTVGPNRYECGISPPFWKRDL